MSILLIGIIKKTETASLLKRYHKQSHFHSIVPASEVVGPLFDRPLQHVVKSIAAHEEFCLWLQ